MLLRFIVITGMVCLQACADLPPPAKPGAPASGVMLIAGTDFTTGFLSAFDPSTGRVYRDIVPLHSDALLAYQISPFALQRLGADSLRRLDQNAGYASVFDQSLGARTNPQGLAFLPGNQVAVSFYNRNTIDIRSAVTGMQTGSIDLSAWADADGFAEIAHLLFHFPYLYAAVQRLNRQASDAVWPPSGTSYLLRIDISDYSIAAYPLAHANPVSRLHYNAGRGTLVFAAPGRFAANYTLDGACLEFDLGTFTFRTAPLTETQALYEITDCDIKPDGSGVFIGYDSQRNSVLGSFDPAIHAVTGLAAQLSSSTGGFFADFQVHSGGKVYLADRNLYQPGLRIFSGTLLTEDTQQPVYTGLPPLSLVEIP